MESDQRLSESSKCSRSKEVKYIVDLSQYTGQVLNYFVLSAVFGIDIQHKRCVCTSKFHNPEAI